MNGFVHLRVHSEYSVSDGLAKIPALVNQCVALQMPAVALTDQNNLFALVKFYQKCVTAGIKPIVGVDLHVQEAWGISRLVALAMNEQGYRRLRELVSGDTPTGVLAVEDLFENNTGLIVLSGGLNSEIGQSLIRDDIDNAETVAHHWQTHFGDRFYLELQRIGKMGEEQYIGAVASLSAKLNIPLVATNDVCFLEETDFEAHEARVCIHDGHTLNDSRRDRRYRSAQYFTSAERMQEKFSDFPQALQNSSEIAKRCNAVVELGTYHLPNYPVPDGQNLDGYISELAGQGLQSRLASSQTEDVEGLYQQRLEFELAIIQQMGFSGYFLIVMEFISWAREHTIPVGPGRGSGPGSLVAYALGITDLDPLLYDLLFERFLNPERVSMPDFDVDFCMEGRDQVIAHVAERYGNKAVSQIITFGTMAAKAVVRDVARVQGKAYGLADKLSKLIPFEVGITLEKAVNETSELRDFIAENDEVSEIMDMAYQLEGVIRNIGRHAGGVVIAPSDLIDFVPLYSEDTDGALVSQFDKDDVESAGLVKFDFLGLKTLTVIAWTVAAINLKRDPDTEPLVMEQVSLEDPETYELMRTGETTGIFQLESRGMKDLIRRLQPDQINDVIALVALFRPGPLQSGAVDDYIDRKLGRAPISYPHPELETVLKDTYGVMLYQEHVMQIAQVLAGFSLGQADLLRRAMGKKKPEEMAKVRVQFVAGARERSVKESITQGIFDQMEKFAGYAFNKAHSSSYAMISFQTAWLKTHHPAEFMAATLSADMQNTDKVVSLVDEARRMKLEVRPPSVNSSLYRFVALGDKANKSGVLYGLGAIKGVGEGPVIDIIANRKSNHFIDLKDFCQRTHSGRVNKRVLDALIRSGAMDVFALAGEDQMSVRARLMAELPAAMLGAEQIARNQAQGINDLFGDVADTKGTVIKQVPPWGKRQTLDHERDALGLYLTGHPIDDYLDELRSYCPIPIKNLAAKKQQQRIGGLVVSIRTMRGRRGDMGFALIDDRGGRIEVSFFSDAFENHRHKLNKDAVLVITGEVEPDEYTGQLRMRAKDVYDIEEARAHFTQCLEIDYCHVTVPEDFSFTLKGILSDHLAVERGCSVAVKYHNGAAYGRVLLGNDWQVHASDQLLASLKQEFGDQRIGFAFSAR